MNITLETWIREKLSETERMYDYEVATETVRVWIDIYNELISAETPINDDDIRI